MPLLTGCQIKEQLKLVHFIHPLRAHIAVCWMLTNEPRLRNAMFVSTEAVCLCQRTPTTRLTRRRDVARAGHTQHERDSCQLKGRVTPCRRYSTESLNRLEAEQILAGKCLFICLYQKLFRQ